MKESARDLGDPGPDNDYGWGLPDGESALESIIMGIGCNETTENRYGKPGKEKIGLHSFVLSNPFPNPFNVFVAIPFRVDTGTYVTVEIVDITGRIVERLIGEENAPGIHHVMWNGSAFASGVYFVRVSTERTGETKKILLLK